MEKLTNKEKDMLSKALELLQKHYDEQESICRRFKWICRDYLPQSGEGYTANINVFEIEHKTIMDIAKSKEEARQLFLKIIN